MTELADISIAQICDAIEQTLDDAVGIERSQSYDEVRETPQSGDTPLLQVYPQSGTCDPSGGADRTSFQAAVRQRHYVIHVDLYARQRSHIRDDMKKATEMIEAIEDILEAQDTGSAFGLTGIKGYNWRWERVIFETGNISFMGARFFIMVKVW